MQASPFAALLRSLAPPALQRLHEAGGEPRPASEAALRDHAAGDSIDFLFLYRTEKKRCYFASLARTALADCRCMLASYHNLPPAAHRPVPPETMAALLGKAERELFSGRVRHWSLILRPLLLRIRRHQIRKIYARLSALLDRHTPAVIVLWNGSKFQDYILHQANRRAIPVLYFENGVLPGTTTIDGRGVNAGNSLPRDASLYRAYAPPARDLVAMPLTDRQPRRHLGRKARPGASLARASGEFNILVPFQKERDTQILEHSTWIKSMPQLFAEISAALSSSGISNYRLWLREHPSAATCYPDLYRQVKSLRQVDFANGGRLVDWLSAMDLVITVNSSLGMEALILAKRVITLGSACYNIPGLVDHADSPAQLHAALLRAMAKPEVDDDLRRGFLKFVAEQYVTTGDWREPDERHWQAVRQRMLAALPREVRTAVTEARHFA